MSRAGVAVAVRAILAVHTTDVLATGKRANLIHPNRAVLERLLLAHVKHHTDRTCVLALRARTEGHGDIAAE